MKYFISIALVALLIVVILPFKKSSLVNSKTEAADPNVLFGLDISHNQKIMSWVTIDTQTKHHVAFVILRSSMGKDRKDVTFQANWDSANALGLIVGAYHYYDPDENSTKQAENYLSTVKLQKGNIVPIVDIERLSGVQPKKKLLKGLRNWLEIVGNAYGVKPMIYSGQSFFSDHLSKEFSTYPLWLAAYSNKRRSDPAILGAHIHQFAECVRIPGIKGLVDGNDLKKEFLEEIVLK